MKKKKELKISRRTVMKGALAAGAMMSAGSIPSKLFAGEYNIPDPLKPLPCLLYTSPSPRDTA